jgi:general secretion pathway protein G
MSKWAFLCFVICGGTSLIFRAYLPHDIDRIPAERAQINVFMTALGSYKLDTGTYPTSAQGLAALTSRPTGVENWNGPYLPKVRTVDSWGQPYLYRYPGEHGQLPDICSYGADGVPGGVGPNADFCGWQQ